MSQAAKKKRAEKTGWYVRNEQGEQYGPVPIETLRSWAEDGRLAPANEVSADGEAWQLVTALRELGMSWVAEVTPGTFYGPIHGRALQELIKEGVLNASSACYVRQAVSASIADAGEDGEAKAQQTKTRAQVAERDAALKRLREENQSAASELARVRQALAGASDEVVALRAKEASLNKVLAEQSQRFEADLCQWKQSVQRAESVSADRARAIADLEGKLAGMERAMTLRTQAEARVTALERERAELRNKLERMEQAAAARQEREKTLETALAEAEQRVADAVREAVSLRSEAACARQALQAASQRDREVVAALRQMVERFGDAAQAVDRQVSDPAAMADAGGVVDAEVLEPEQHARNDGGPPIVNHTRQARPGLSLADLEQQARRELERLGAQGKRFFNKR